MKKNLADKRQKDKSCSETIDSNDKGSNNIKEKVDKVIAIVIVP